MIEAPERPRRQDGPDTDRLLALGAPAWQLAARILKATLNYAAEETVPLP